jgi:hypothetical protein
MLCHQPAPIRKSLNLGPRACLHRFSRYNLSGSIRYKHAVEKSQQCMYSRLHNGSSNSKKNKQGISRKRKLIVHDIHINFEKLYI